MGKRELVIALAFVAAGVIAYQLTAPAPRAGEEPFSISRLWNMAGGRMRGNAAHATVSKSGTIPVSPGTSTLRIVIMGTSRQVRVIGERREDIAYELSVESTGPDRGTAENYANQVSVKADDLGSAVTMRVDFPRGGRQSIGVTVRLPARLGVFTGGSGLDVSHVASAHLDNVSGESRIASIDGDLTGSARNGSLEVRAVGSAKLSLQRTRATFEDVQRTLTLDVRDGDCKVSGVRGPIEIEESRADIQIKNAAGPVRVTGADGRVTLENPSAESTIDARRAEVEVRLAQPVPLTLLTTDDTLRLLLDGPPNVSIDAVATMGQIQAGDFGVKPETIDQDARLTYTFGSGAGARVSLRNIRGNIVVKNFRGTIVDPNRK